MADMPRILIVIGQVLSDPWLSITLGGQFPTWLRDADRLGIPVRHSHATRPRQPLRFLDSAHEWLRWHGQGRTLVPRVDSWIGRLFLERVPQVETKKFLQTGAVSWSQKFPDLYLLQRWKVIGSLSQALTEDFEYVYFTTASSYVRVDRLIQVIAPLPKTGVYAGTQMTDALSGCMFASGANRVLSRDVAEAVVGHQLLYRNDVLEDVGLGRIISGLGYNLVPLPTLNLDSEKAVDELTSRQLATNFHYRLTSWSGKSRNDVTLMLRLHERIQDVMMQGGGDDA